MNHKFQVGDSVELTELGVYLNKNNIANITGATAAPIRFRVRSIYKNLISLSHNDSEEVLITDVLYVRPAVKYRCGFRVE